MTGWVRQQPYADKAGPVGGDIQVGEAFNARWIRALPDGTFAVVTRTYYPAVDGGHRFLECDTEYAVCTDPADPGSTEQWSEGRPSPCEGDPTDEGALNAALAASEPTDIEWNVHAPAWAAVSE